MEQLASVGQHDDPAARFTRAPVWLMFSLLVLGIGWRLIVVPIEAIPIGPVSYAANGIVQLAAAGACSWRALRDPDAYREGWLAVALAFAALAFSTFYQLIMGLLGQLNINAALDLMLQAVAIVPLIFILSSPHSHARTVRVFDALASLALALSFYFFILQVLLPGDQLDERGVHTLIWMFDTQNIFLTGFALLRFITSRDAPTRSFFGSLTIFAAVYGVSNAIINRYIRGMPVGGTWDFLYDLPVLVLIILAARFVLPPMASARGEFFSRVVKEIIPFVLPLSLFALSLAMTLYSATLAIIASVVAVAIYGARMAYAVLHSMSERDKFARMSAVDALTGLANRRRFEEALALAQLNTDPTAGAADHRQGAGLALVMIDIDHFKLLNDQMGHQAGDDRLRAVGQGLLQFSARAGDLVARYGGEEFAAILSGISEEASLRQAERICADIAELNLPSPSPFGRVTVSVGVAWIANPREIGGAELLRQADAALYASKAAGRNRATASWKLEDAQSSAGPRPAS